MRLFWLAAVSAVALSGCGGGGGGASMPGPTPTPVPEVGTATFSVDLEKGIAVPTAMTGGGNAGSGIAGRGLYTGSTVSFATTEVFTDPGEITRKRVKLRMRNNSGETIGTQGPIRVAITQLAANNSALLDLRTLTRVETVAGTGGTGTDEGPQATTAIGTPSGATFAGTNGFITGANGRLRLIRNAYVSTLRGSQLDPQAMVYLVSPLTGQEYAVYCEAGAHVVRSINLGTASLTTLAGGVGTSGDAVGSAAAARFNQPSGIAIESQSSLGGTLLVTDRVNGKVKRITYSWAGGGPTASLVELKYSAINQPNGIAVSPQGWVAVAESGTARVRVYPGGGSNWVTLGAATGSLPGAGNAVNLVSTYGVAYYGEQLALTADYNVAFALLRPGASPIIPQNWYLGQLAFAQAGMLDATGDQASASQDLRHLSISDGGQILLADAGNNRLRLIDANRGFLEIGRIGDTVAGSASIRVTNASAYYVTDGGSLRTPYIDYDIQVPAGTTADLGDIDLAIPEGITKFSFTVTVDSPTSSPASLDAVLNSNANLLSSNRIFIRNLMGFQDGFAVDGPLGTAYSGSISGIAAPADGGVYFTDSGRSIRRLDKRLGRITTIAGSLTTSSTTDGFGTAARLSGVNAIAATEDGNYIYAAQSNHCIRVAGFTGAVSSERNDARNWRVATIVGTPDTPGDANGFGLNARFTNPRALGMYPGGSALMTGQDNGIQGQIVFEGSDRFDPASYRYVRAINYGFARITHIAIGKSGRSAFLYEESGTGVIRARVSDSPFGAYQTITASGPNALDGTGTSGVILGANGLAIDAAGYIYIGDGFRLRRYDGNSLRTSIGVFGTVGADGVAGNARLPNLNALAIDPSGDMYAAGSGRFMLIQRIVR